MPDSLRSTFAHRIAFVDESFDKWFGLAEPTSNFCYGAISMPVESLKAAAKLCEGTLDALRREGCADEELSELKGKEILRVPSGLRSEIARRFGTFFKKHHCKLFGFYASAEGFIKNHIRNEHYELTNEEFSELKQSGDISYEEWWTRLVSRWKEAVCNVGLLEDLFRDFVGIIVQFHVSNLKQSFHIVIDRTNREEEEELSSLVQEVAELVRKVHKIPPAVFARYFKGASFRSSDQFPGLQLADCVAAGFRRVFRQFPELLSDKTQFEILSAKSNPAMLRDAAGRVLPYYESRMDSTLAEGILSKQSGELLACFAPFFAKQMFSYITAEGASRHCLISPRVYRDMAD